MARIPVTVPVSASIGHANVTVHPSRIRPYQGDLPWAALATVCVTFHFGRMRSRIKVLKARHQLGWTEPTPGEMAVAKRKAVLGLIDELAAHGVAVTSIPGIRDCGISSWRPGRTL